jgi:hypothetical protein
MKNADELFVTVHIELFYEKFRLVIASVKLIHYNRLPFDICDKK